MHVQVKNRHSCISYISCSVPHIHFPSYLPSIHMAYATDLSNTMPACYRHTYQHQIYNNRNTPYDKIQGACKTED